MTKPNTKKLTLARETLRTLTSNELRLVAGGKGVDCTVYQSGCSGSIHC